MKKIMFDDQHGLTKAVLEGRKTMTRRIISKEKYPLLYSWQQNRLRFEILGNDTLRVWYKAEPQSLRTVDHFDIRIPLQIGDVVAVAQNYKDVYSDKDFGKEGQIDWEYINSFDMRNTAGFTNKMFVRADLMPHQIRITHVRVERLQGINDKDCLREGIIENTIRSEFGGIINNYTYKGAPGVYVFPREAFSALINRLYGKGTWDSNPWVFVYEFELVK